MFCPKCGSQLPEGTKFCSSCGTPIPEAEPLDSALEQSGSMPAPESGSAMDAPMAAPASAMDAPLAASSSAMDAPPSAMDAPMDAPMAAPASAMDAPPSAMDAPMAAPASAMDAPAAGPNFGTPVEIPPAAGASSVPPTTPPPFGGQAPASAAAPKKKSKTPIIIVAVVVVLVIIIALALMLMRGCSGGGSSASGGELYNPPAGVSLMTDGDGEAAALFANGDWVTIDDDIDEGKAAPDGSAIAYINSDNDLYVANGDGSDPKHVDSRVDVVRSVSAQSVIYEDLSDYTLHAYLIDSGDSVDLGAYDSSTDVYMFAQTTSSVAFTTKEGEMMVWADGTNGNATSVADLAGTIEILAVSSDAGIVIWSEIEDGDETLMAYEDGDVVTLGKIYTGATGSYGYCYAHINADESAYDVTSYDTDTFFYKEVGNDEVMELEAGADLGSTTISSVDGPLPRISGPIDEAYVLTDDQLGYLDFGSGEMTEIAKNVDQYAVRSGTLAFLKGSKLYVTDADGRSADDATQLASNVLDMQVSDNGTYVYYMTDNSELYMYKMGESDPMLVTNDAAYEDGVLTGSITFGNDGETLYYVEEGGSDYTLYSYNYGDNESTEILDTLANAYLLEGLRYIGDNDTFYFQADGDAVYMFAGGEATKVLDGVGDLM